MALHPREADTDREDMDRQQGNNKAEDTALRKDNRDTTSPCNHKAGDLEGEWISAWEWVILANNN